MQADVKRHLAILFKKGGFLVALNCFYSSDKHQDADH